MNKTEDELKLEDTIKELDIKIEERKKKYDELISQYTNDDEVKVFKITKQAFFIIVNEYNKVKIDYFTVREHIDKDEKELDTFLQTENPNTKNTEEATEKLMNLNFDLGELAALFSSLNSIITIMEEFV